MIGNLAVASGDDGAAHEVVLVCIRPHDADAVIRSLRFNAGQIVISAMAGVSLASLRELSAPAVACRAIPLPALADGEGATPIYPSPASARALFDRLGGTVELAGEAQFDAFSTATSTIAAHFVYLATIADWLTEQGVARTDADRYVAGILSSLDLTPSATEPLRDLARHHATPGGINEAFTNHLVSAGLPNAVRDGLVRIFARLNGRS